jgi:hypothetical protein
MAAWLLFDYVDGAGANDFYAWSRGLQSEDLARLNRKIKMLEDNGPNLGPKLLAGPLKGYAHIYKLRVRGLTELRPLLCKGPIDYELEFTLLKGASEVGGQWVPASAPSEARTRRQEVINDADNRRCEHVKVSR